MATTPISNNYASLIWMAQQARAGATNLASIPLLIHTAAAIGADYSAVLLAQSQYKAEAKELSDLFEAMSQARQAARAFCLKAKSVLEFHLGPGHNSAWESAGFLNSVKVPSQEAGLAALAPALQAYFGDHENHENADLGVTAGEAETHANALSSSRQNLNARINTATSKKQNRDAKVMALRKRLRGLCKELAERLGPLDSRWREFGLNLPGAPSVPRVPQNVVVTPLAGARLQIGCDASPNATRYRFFYQRPIEDAEPTFAGNSMEPLFITDALEPGQTYLVFVSAVNDSAESELSAPVSVTAAQAAAA